MPFNSVSKTSEYVSLLAGFWTKTEPSFCNSSLEPFLVFISTGVSTVHCASPRSRVRISRAFSERGLCLRLLLGQTMLAPLREFPSQGQLQLPIFGPPFDQSREDIVKQHGKFQDRLPGLVAKGRVQCATKVSRRLVVAIVHRVCGPQRQPRIDDLRNCQALLYTACQNRTVRLERQGGPAFRFHLRRRDDRRACGVRVFVLIQEQLRKIGCHHVIFRFRVQQSFVKISSVFKLAACQRNLAAGSKLCANSASNFAPSGFPAAARDQSAAAPSQFFSASWGSPLREQFDIGRRTRDATAVDFHCAGPVFVVVLSEQVADRARQLRPLLDESVNGVLVAMNLMCLRQFRPRLADRAGRKSSFRQSKRAIGDSVQSDVDGARRSPVKAVDSQSILARYEQIPESMAQVREIRILDECFSLCAGNGHSRTLRRYRHNGCATRSVIWRPSPSQV